MDQSEFSVVGATGNSNASVIAKSAVPFLSPLPQSLLVFLSLLKSQRCALSARTLSRLSRKGLSAVYGFRNTPKCVRGCFLAFVTRAIL